MKKIVILLALFFSTPASAMNHDSIKKALDDYTLQFRADIQSRNKKKSWRRLKTNIAALGAIPHKVKTSFIFSRLPFFNINKRLLVLWKDDIDINLSSDLQSSTLRIYEKKPLPLYNALVKEYLYCYYPYDLDTYAPEVKKFIDFIVKHFKNKLNINIASGDESRTPFLMICLWYLILDHSYAPIASLLESFLKDFQHSIDDQTADAYGQTVFNACANSKEIKINNKASILKETNFENNRPKLLTLLKKYFPDKLCCTKDKFETLHNCHFRFQKNYDN